MYLENSFKKDIEDWFHKNQRDMPWRETTNPYYIWLSEVMLQQTQVNTVIDYYYRFIHRFPTIQSLSEANEDEVLKYWEGLGYYSRARNFHTAVKKLIIIMMARYHTILNHLKVKRCGSIYSGGGHEYSFQSSFSNCRW